MLKAMRWMITGQQQVISEQFDYDEAALGPRDIAVRNEFTAISPGTECANYLGLEPDVFVPGKWCTYPWPPGYSGVGHVLRTGSLVTEFQEGDRVLLGTCHTSHTTVNADTMVVPALPGVNAEHASYIMLISISMTALQVLDNDPFATVAVWGLGMIGNLAAQLLHRAGGRVIGIDPVRERRELALRCGIDEVLDPADAGFNDALWRLTRGEGLDIAVDTTGHAPTTIAIPAFMRRRGQMVLLTHWRSQPVVDATTFIHQVFSKGITVHGAHANSPGSEPGGDHMALQRRKWMKIQHHLETGGIAIEPLISHRIQPTQCKEAYDGLCFDRARWWGVVVNWRADSP